MAHPEYVPILNDQANITPILNGNLSIHAICLKLKKDPFPSKLCSHIPSKVDTSRPPGPTTRVLQIFCGKLKLLKRPNTQHSGHIGQNIQN